MTILHHMEKRGLIHKCFKMVPLETEDDIMEARKKAASLTRRYERDALLAGQPIPVPMEPASLKKVWGWGLGTFATTERGHRIHEINPDPKSPSEADWYAAEQVELSYWERKKVQNEMRQVSHAMRTEHRKREIAGKKAEEAIIAAEGRGEMIRKEAARARALMEIHDYALNTGCDCSEWYDEIKVGELGWVPNYEYEHKTLGGAMPMRKKPNDGLRLR
jgi:hypothetical protein